MSEHGDRTAERYRAVKKPAGSVEVFGEGVEGAKNETTEISRVLEAVRWSSWSSCGTSGNCKETPYRDNSLDSTAATPETTH